METAFQWNESYSVKVHAMDAQHKRLFDIIRELYTAMHSGKGKDVAGGVIRNLIDYTVNHFAAEEKLMKENGYPSFAAHCAKHRDLEATVVAFKKDFDKGSKTVTPELMKFLQSWLTTHILTIDQKYTDFLNSRGVH